VATEDERENQGEEKGFAGLSAMVSDVDATVASIQQQAQRMPSGSSSQQSAQSDHAAHQKQTQPTQNTYQPPTLSSGGSSTGKWLFGIAAVIGVIWLASQTDHKRSSVPARASGSSSTSVTPAPALPVAPPPVPSRPTEEKPSVGRNSVLTTAQIRYCLAEKIRLDAAEVVINNYINSDVERFNGYVTDYNSRCGEFRYRQGALESARRDVEPYRAQIQLEGRSRFVRSPTAEATAPTAPRSAPDPMVQAVQLRLNELGYAVGTADGLFGGETRAAIQAFQRNRGLAADGVANAALLRQLEVAVPQNRKQNSNPNSTPTSFPSTSQSRTPANSWVSGSTWYCNDGYRKIGDRCEAFKVPANSWVSGSTWYCNDGYRKIGDRCEAFKTPANSWVSGSTWYCNDGYRKVGDKCEAFEAPANSWVSGSTWYCNDGYRKVGDKCVSVFK